MNKILKNNLPSSSLITVAEEAKNKLRVHDKTYEVNKIVELYYHDTLIQACQICKKILCPLNKNQHVVWRHRISFISKEKIGEILTASHKVQQWEEKLITAHSRSNIQRIWQGMVQAVLGFIEKLTCNLIKITPQSTDLIELKLIESLDELETKKRALDPLFKENYRLITDNYPTVKQELDDRIYQLGNQLNDVRRQKELSEEPGSKIISTLIELKQQIAELKKSRELLEKVHTFFMEEAIS